MSSEISVQRLASTVGIPVERVLQQLQEAGVPATTADYRLTEQQETLLLRYLRERHAASSPDRLPGTVSRANRQQIASTPPSPAGGQPAEPRFASGNGTNDQMTQEIRNAFSSRAISAEIVDVVAGLYHLLLDASHDARSDQIEQAREYANDNPTKDIIPALRLFESARGRNGERLFTSRLIARLSNDETHAALGLPEKEINQLRSLFSELRGCCLILEQHRHIWAHENTEV
jgi:hypothetical protein